jgi:hypothetical protein
VKTVRPTYTFAEAKARCLAAGGSSYQPCFGCDPISQLGV